jgi:hypothetical protein
MDRDEFEPRLIARTLRRVIKAASIGDLDLSRPGQAYLSGVADGLEALVLYRKRPFSVSLSHGEGEKEGHRTG